MLLSTTLAATSVRGSNNIGLQVSLFFYVVVVITVVFVIYYYFEHMQYIFVNLSYE